MVKKSATLLAMLAALLFAPTAVLAQDAEAPADSKVEGKFRLTLNGQAPENVSFWVESSIGGGGVICTTDAAMIETGITACRDGGEVNEMSYSAPAGSTLDYRIVGSQGAELSQRVIAEGSRAVESGFVVDASYTFSSEPVGGEPSGTQPESTTSTDDEGDDGAAGDQYEDASSGSGDASPDKGESNAASGVLPDTGGSSLVLVAGAALLLAAGGFLAYRTIR